MVFLSPAKIPVINMEDLKPGSKAWKLTCQEVRHSLEEYGCFMAMYNGVSQQLKNQVFDGIKPLFDLPKETKLNNISDKPFHGYIPPAPIRPLYESFGIQNVTNLDDVQSFSNLMWPSTGNEPFSKTIHSYTTLVSQLQKIVIKMVFESYGVEKYYDAYNESMSYLLKIMKYKSAKTCERNLAVAIHTDKSFLSILCQNKVNALEVQLKNDEWVNVEFLPSSFVVMTTDALMAWGNGRLRSPHHRVVMKSEEDRYSLGFFTYIKGIIETPKELIDEDHPQIFKPFDHFKLLEFFAKDMTYVDERVIKLFCGV